MKMRCDGWAIRLIRGLSRVFVVSLEKKMSRDRNSHDWSIPPGGLSLRCPDWLA